MRVVAEIGMRLEAHHAGEMTDIGQHQKAVIGQEDRRHEAEQAGRPAELAATQPIG